MTIDQIDRYQVIEECGRGGMAVVYQAHDPRKDRQVAIKLMLREFMYDQKFRQRFQREIETHTAFRHPAVVPIYGYGQWQGQLYLVMRYMPGGSLEDRLTRQGKFSPAEVVSFLEQIGPALDAAHQQGIVHRDIKPSNFLYDEVGKIYIADFGIVRLAENAGVTSLTGNNMIGSPAYMSPEQVRIGSGVDGRADIYSMGVMVFEMLTGKLPYIDEQALLLAKKHIMDPIPDILSVEPKLPPGFREVINTAMAKKADERFQTLFDLTAAVTDAVGGRAIPARRPTPAPSPAIDPSPSRPRTPAAAPPAAPPPPAAKPVAPKPAAPKLPAMPAIPSVPSGIAVPPFLRPLFSFLRLPTRLAFPRLPRLPRLRLPRFRLPGVRLPGAARAVSVGSVKAPRFSLRPALDQFGEFTRRKPEVVYGCFLVTGLLAVVTFIAVVAIFLLIRQDLIRFVY